MSGGFLILAQLPLPKPTSKVPGFWASDVFLIIGAALVLGGIIAAWVFLSRRPKTDVSPARRVYKGTPAPGTSAETGGSGDQRKLNRKRSRRREHRARNPTLSETGGLPPPRGPEAPLIP